MCGQRQGGAEGAYHSDGTDNGTPPLGKQTRKTGTFFAGNRLTTQLALSTTLADSAEKGHEVFCPSGAILFFTHTRLAVWKNVLRFY